MKKIYFILSTLVVQIFFLFPKVCMMGSSGKELFHSREDTISITEGKIMLAIAANGRQGPREIN